MKSRAAGPWELTALMVLVDVPMCRHRDLPIRGAQRSRGLCLEAGNSALASLLPSSLRFSRWVEWKEWAWETITSPSVSGAEWPTEARQETGGGGGP